MYRGQAGHPVFVALKDTVAQYDIPIEPFDRLIRAFEQDQVVTRYQTFDDVFAYCVNSANPVGHLVLYLCGYRDSERQQLSDSTCTALQLANFWQDEEHVRGLWRQTTLASFRTPEPQWQTILDIDALEFIITEEPRVVIPGPGGG